MVNLIGAVIPWFTMNGTNQLYHMKLEKTIEREENFDENYSYKQE